MLLLADECEAENAEADGEAEALSTGCSSVRKSGMTVVLIEDAGGQNRIATAEPTRPRFAGQEYDAGHLQARGVTMLSQLLISSLLLATLATAGGHVAGSSRPGAILRIGAGQPFPTIGAAVTAAGDGDVLLVDPGVYPAFVVVDRSLTIASSAGAGSPFVVQQAVGMPAIAITGLSTGRTVTILHAATAFTDGRAPAVRISGCSGSVRMHDLSVDLPTNLPNATARAAMEIVNSPNVWFEDLSVIGTTPPVGNTVTLQGAPIANQGGLSAILLDNSTATFDHVMAQGFDNTTPVAGETWGGDGLRMLGSSHAWLVRELTATPNVLAGGFGSTFGGSAVHRVAIVQPAGVIACGPAVFLLGSAGNANSRGGEHAIDGDRGIVQAGGTSFHRTVPACLGESQGSLRFVNPTLQPGTTAQLELSTMQNRAWFVALSDTTTTSTGPAGSRQLIDPTAGVTIVLALGFYGGAPQTIALAIPNLPALSGLPLTAQGVLAPPAGGLLNTLALTMPAMGVVLP
jgi:hypothetical protein